MKVDIFFTINSFNFNGPVNELIGDLTEASALIARMNSEEFIRFSTSSDFYNDIIPMLYGPESIPEAGVLSSLLYDGKFNLAGNRKFETSEVTELINKEVPTEDNRWLSIFGVLPTSVVINYPVRNVKHEKDIIEFSKDVLRNNTLSSVQYSEAFKGMYRSLVFHPQYDDLDNITSGCVNFLEGIFEMFDEMNCYTPEDGDTENDIKYLDKKIKFTTCEEGGGKKKRKTKGKKLDFEFEIDGYTTEYNCEYHCKLEFTDGQYKTGKYHDDNRMYFGFYKPTNKANKFLIAHLGDHL
ncbi:hypothetical protein AB4452_12875 [Vibrio lentus]